MHCASDGPVIVTVPADWHVSAFSSQHVPQPKIWQSSVCVLQASELFFWSVSVSALHSNCRFQAHTRGLSSCVELTLVLKPVCNSLSLPKLEQRLDLMGTAIDLFLHDAVIKCL